VAERAREAARLNRCLSALLRDRLGSSSAIVCAIETGIHPEDSARERHRTQTRIR
jgi:hypothetical protein